MWTFLKSTLAGLTGLVSGWQAHAAIETPPAALPDGNTKDSGLNLTTIAGYAILGGLVFYFGKKIIK